MWPYWGEALDESSRTKLVPELSGGCQLCPCGFLESLLSTAEHGRQVLYILWRMLKLHENLHPTAHNLDTVELDQS